MDENDGNLTAWMQYKLQEFGKPVEDQYMCDYCATIVLDRDWNPNLKCCNKCVNEATNYGAF